MLKRMELQFAEAAEKAKQSFASNDISETSVEIEDLSTDGDVEEVELEKEEVEAGQYLLADVTVAMWRWCDG